MATTYTPASGGTVPGQQLAQTNNMMGNMSSAQIAPMVADTQQQLATNLSPETRQTVVNNSNLPAQQANYDQMAKQLYEYDKMHLQPKYSQAPAQPSDALSYGRVGPSDLMQLTPELAAGPTSLYADNPKYAVSSQVAQKENIISLLDALNTSISRELTSKRGQYASTVDSQKEILKGLLGFLDKAEDREERGKDRASQAADRAAALSKRSTTLSEVNGRRVLIDTDTGDIIKDIGVATNPSMARKDQEEVDRYADALTWISDAKTKLETSGSGVQYKGSGIRRSLPSVLGGLDQTANDTIAIFSELNKSLFKVSGTAFTKSEESLLKGLKLDIESSPEANKSALDQAEKLYDRALTRKTLRSQGWNDNDIEEYLREKGLGI